MYSSTPFVLLGVLVCASIASVDAQSKTCNLKEVDMCLTNFYYDQRGIPANEKQLRKTCSSTKTLRKCLHTYFHRCMSLAYKETAMIVSNAILNPFLDTCAKPSDDPTRVEVFKYAKCLNTNMKKIQTCGESNRDMVFFALESSYERRIPILCCNAKVVAECTENKTIELCDREHAEYQKKYYSIGQVFLDVCSQYDPKGPSCSEYMVPDGFKSSEDPKSALSRMISTFL